MYVYGTWQELCSVSKLSPLLRFASNAHATENQNQHLLF